MLIDIRVGDSCQHLWTLKEEIDRGNRPAFDLVFTSPPYNMREPGLNAGRRGSRLTWANSELLNEGYPDHSDDLPYDEYVAWQRETIAAMWDVLANDGAIFYNHKPRMKKKKLFHPMVLIPDHVPIRQIIIWDRKAGYPHIATGFAPSHEYIFLLAKPDWKILKGKRGIKDVWSVGYARNNEHPAPFPVELPARAIKATGAQNVLDPFCGSGTTGLAAMASGCASFTGVDLHANFSAWTQVQMTIQDMTRRGEQIPAWLKRLSDSGLTAFRNSMSNALVQSGEQK